FGNHPRNAEDFPGQRSAGIQTDLFSERDRVEERRATSGPRGISRASWFSGARVPGDLRRKPWREAGPRSVTRNRCAAAKQTNPFSDLRRRRATRDPGGAWPRNAVAEF